MQIMLTLREVMLRCRNWDEFCEDKKLSTWIIKEGGGDSTIFLTEQDARKYGIIRDKGK